MTAALVAAVLFAAARPPAPRPTPASGQTSPSIPGAYHIHTTRSDGALDRDAIALAASRAGLKFAIFTDHGDATRVPDAPQYVHGVLCLDGVEISTNDGHYVALGMGKSPYPLGGDGDAVAEDVARLGGFGIAAHPFSARPELAWRDWTVPMGGLEWLNADSEWRDEGRVSLGRAVVGYPIWGARTLASLFDRPVTSLAKWDELAFRHPVVALAAHDAHGGFGRESGSSERKLPIPSYDATFRSFSIRAIVEGFPTGDAVRDADLLLTAIRHGSVFTVVDALAEARGMDFAAVSGTTTVKMGGTVPAGRDPVRFTVRADVPSGASTVLLRDGRPVGEVAGGALDHQASEPGSYRVEVRVPHAAGTPPVPWLLSNPIYRRSSDAVTLPPEPVIVPVSLPDGPWRMEASPGSVGVVTAEGAATTVGFELADGPRVSQFVALVRDFATGADYSRVTFAARASRPMRISAQLRFATDGNRRWRRSFYADVDSRGVTIPLERLRPADDPGPRPPSTRVSSILFVVDLTNASPGSDGSFTISDLALAR